MEAEKAIANLWLEENGFFTIKDINAGKSVIDIIAIKFSKEGIKSAKHVEVSCSLKGELPESEYRKRFEGSDIRKKISEVLQKYVPDEIECESVLVTNAPIPKGALEGVEIVPFNSVIAEVIEKIDTQNYHNNIIRALQLMKYSLMKPGLMKNIGGKRFKKELKNMAIEHFSEDDMVKKLASDDSSVEKVLRKSKLRSDPKKLGAVLKHMLTTAERKTLSEEVITAEQRARKKAVKEKTLSSFCR